MATKVVLTMIVRDESAILRDRLLAVRDEVDAFCILDTGSVDDTPAIVCDVFAEMPGRLGFRDWKGFADARTAAVAGATDWAAAQADDGEWWALLLDADTVAHFTPGWRAHLVGDAVSCEVHHGTLRYSHPRLLRLGACDWTWHGVLHEYLEMPATMRQAATTLLHVEHGHGGARELDPDKFKKDAELLERTRAENAEPWLDARYCFYLAQSYRDAGMIDESIATYIERAQMGGWIGEQFIAYLRAGEMTWECKKNWAGAHALWVAAWSVDPNRAEALIGLASLERVRQMWVPCYEHGRLAQKIVTRNGAKAELFADQNVLFRADFEVAVAGSWVNTKESKQEGRRACLKLINGPYAPADVKVEAKRWITDYYKTRARKR